MKNGGDDTADKEKKVTSYLVVFLCEALVFIAAICFIILCVFSFLIFSGPPPLIHNIHEQEGNLVCCVYLLL